MTGRGRMQANLRSEDYFDKVCVEVMDFGAYAQDSR
jgi:hypothetical protein